MIDTSSFLVIVATAALAGVIATSIEPRFAIPVVVLELLLGIAEKLPKSAVKLLPKAAPPRVARRPIVALERSGLRKRH